jgi:hypothetical protein
MEERTVDTDNTCQKLIELTEDSLTAEDQDIVIGSVGPESVEAGILDDLLVRRANLPGGTGTQLV